MRKQAGPEAPLPSSARWLRSYYFTRASASTAWIIIAVVTAATLPAVSAFLLLAYPAWDALANYADAQKSGGLRVNPSQSLNFAASLLTALAVVIALGSGMKAVITVFGAWAIVSGLLQLITAARRWRTAGAQWLMILSGAQSALAGGFFFKMAAAATPPTILAVVPYAAFGAFYFLLSAIWLTVKIARQRKLEAAVQPLRD